MANDLVLAALDRLSQEEKMAYDLYSASGKPSLSVDTSLKLYELFLQGTSCQEISRLNPGFGLGMIVKARVDHLWDSRRDSHLTDLYAKTGERLRQIGLESVNFISDFLAAIHKSNGDKIKRYLQTGDEDLLKTIDFSPKQYKEFIEILGKVTGAENKKTLEHKGTVTTVVESAPSVLTPGQAAKLLELIDKD